MKINIEVYENSGELQEWEDNREYNESIGIKMPEKKTTLQPLWFKMEDLKRVYFRGDGKLSIVFEDDDYISEPTKGFLKVLDQHFKDSFQVDVE